MELIQLDVRSRAKIRTRSITFKLHIQCQMMLIAILIQFELVGVYVNNKWTSIINRYLTYIFTYYMHSIKKVLFNI